MLNYRDTPIYECSQLQKRISLTSTEAEYIAQCDAEKQIVWLRRVLEELKISQEPTKMFPVNSACLKLADGEGAKHFSRSKHMDIRHDNVNQLADKNYVKHTVIQTEKMGADFLTKQLASAQIQSAIESAMFLRIVMLVRFVLLIMRDKEVMKM